MSFSAPKEKSERLPRLSPLLLEEEEDFDARLVKFVQQVALRDAHYQDMIEMLAVRIAALENRMNRIMDHAYPPSKYPASLSR